MSTKRILAAMLCASLLLSTAACSSGDAQETTADTADQTADTMETETSPYDPGLPDRDFGGEDFIFAVRGTESDYPWDINDVDVDGVTGDPVNDAVYERTTYLEDKYNVHIDALLCGDLGQEGTLKIISDAVMTNDDSFEAILSGLNETAGDLTLNGYLVDMNTMENLNLSQPWWDQNALKGFSFGNKVYFTTGELTTVDNGAVHILLFDKSLVEQYNLDDPYTDVLEGKWTMDKMMANSEIVTTDLNGDGKMNEDDRFGFLYWPDVWISFLHGMGNTVGELGEDGMPRHTLLTERIVDSWMKAIALLQSGNTLSRKTEMDIFKSDQEQSTVYMLENHNVLYVYETVIGILILRDIDTDFGVLPYPKLNEEQESYYNTISGWGAAALSVPVCNNNLADTGFMLEAYCAKSAELLTPAFYDKQLTRKGVRDEESAQMLELIFSTLRYDIGYVFGWGEMAGSMVNLVNAKRDTIASTINSKLKAVETDIQKNIDKLLAIEE